MTTIVTITGSVRDQSLNHRLLAFAADELEAAGAEVDRIEPDAIDFPLYNADLQAEQGIPGAVTDLHQRLTAASGVVIASPEYNGAFSPLLKNTIDWVTRIDMATFQPRLLGLLGASPGARGAVHGLGLLAQMFAYMRCTVHEPHFSLPRAGDVIGHDGLMADDADRLRSWAADYLEATRVHAESVAITAGGD
jgi:NAD(P)H-dependent FMN reductase